MRFSKSCRRNKRAPTAGRLLDKHGGDYGYMVIMQLSDLEEARARLAGSASASCGRPTSAMPRARTCTRRTWVDAILSLDWMDPPESWKWAGPEWEKHVDTDTVTALSGVIVAVPDPEATASRWADVFGVAASGAHIALDHDTSISFVKSERPEDEGVCGIEVVAAEPRRAGETSSICGIDVNLV